MATALDADCVSIDGSVPMFMQAPHVRAFWQYLRTLPCPTGIVRLTDFDLMDIHRLAPEMIICDVDIESCRNRIRFVGTRVVELFDEESTGRYLDEINIGPYRSQQLAAFNMAVASGCPQWTSVCVTRPANEAIYAMRQPSVTYERLVVPLAGDGGVIAQLAAIVVLGEGDCVRDGFQHMDVPIGRH